MEVRLLGVKSISTKIIRSFSQEVWALSSRFSNQITEYPMSCQPAGKSVWSMNLEQTSQFDPWLTMVSCFVSGPIIIPIVNSILKLPSFIPRERVYGQFKSVYIILTLETRVGYHGKTAFNFPNWWGQVSHWTSWWTSTLKRI